MKTTMRQVKFLNEADRPKEEKPLEYTEWCKDNSRTPRNERDDCMNFVVGDYVSYLATFGDKKPVEPIKLTHRLIYTGATPCNSIEEYDMHDEITCLYNSKKDGMALFKVFDGEEEALYIGYLNSSYY